MAIIEKVWRERPVLWLSGVRRVGKTCLCQSLRNIEYFDCELPRVRRMLEDPQEFWARLAGRRVVLDEVHRLPNPSEVLKVAADHFPGVRVLATGSSTLGASARFRDTLTGRKRDVWLTPMTLADLADFQRPDLRHRFLHGGLPPSSWPAPSRTGTSRNGWMRTGPRISRSCSAWNGGSRSSASWSS
jgi:predicted AAA+ superfamily ATPase